MTLTWRHDAHGWVAACGSEQQGRVRVIPFRGGWVWVLDMLPGTDEPMLRCGDTYVQLDDAKADAEKQVQEWPTPIDGAVRV